MPYKIKIASDQRFGKKVPVQINGQKSELDIDREIDVSKEVREALDNAAVRYTLISSDEDDTDSPQGEQGAEGAGVAPSASDEVTGTATRLEPAVDDRPSPEQNADPAAPVPELLNADELSTDDLREAGEAIDAVKDAAEKLGDTGDKSDGETAAGREADSGDKAEDAKPVNLDQSIEKLEAELEGVTDRKALDAALDAEKAGKDRAGAKAAIQARIDQLAE